MTEHNWKKRLTSSLVPALLVVLPLCLFGPFTIFSGNEAEFNAPFWVLVRPLLFTGAGLVLVLVALAVVLPNMLFRPYVSLLFGLGLVLWIQGNFLVADYGPFTGAVIDWTIESWRNPYEMALWIAVPALSVVAARHTFPIAPFASGALVALQLAVLVASAVRADRATPAKWDGLSDSMFELSRKQNVLHIVLDGFQSDVFGEILAEERRALDRSLSGAVFFANHTGAFPTTIASIPAMLTGRVYRNERGLQTYVRNVFQQGSLFKSLRAGAYRVDSVTGMHHDKESATNYYRMPRPYVSYEDYTQFTAWQLADLSLFRHAPHILRPSIYNEQSWRLQTRFGPGDTRTRRHHPVNGAVVLRDFARRLTLGTDEPLYKFIHVGIPHQPVAVNADCQFIGVVRATRDSYKEQARCAVRRTAAILDRLKEMGVYDKTFVVISSDHGIGFAPPSFENDRPTPAGQLSTLAGKAMALLVVKPLDSQGPVRVSEAPTSITDIPGTVLEGIGVAHALPGVPALTLADHAPRSRAWAMYDWEHEDWSQQYFDTLDILQIDGRVLDGANWKLIETIYAGAATEAARARGLYETHRSRSGVEYRWSMPNVFFHVRPGTRVFEMKVRSIAAIPQTVTVSAGDRVLGVFALKDQSWVTLKHALPPPKNPDVNWVHVKIEPPWRPRGTGRLLGVQTRDIIFAP
ncbi:MAG TPA: sulfatase-like hydrolase/transferase [Vicinamibacterales bacterium]|nr:sulfatase-like hydrolase/transferase [Vicinamibacterales bacterium]